ncbi:hypothetical protein [Apilactobacillus micheneri]|uniref:hypothetical protein n=1 Tax=Apilactobacillus micheneri TaxID=1899430 RepID=UPI00112E7F1F|nr:hypothetical protein [Apilactobacillus micheneri]
MPIITLIGIPAFIFVGLADNNIFQTLLFIFITLVSITLTTNIINVFTPKYKVKNISINLMGILGITLMIISLFTALFSSNIRIIILLISWVLLFSSGWVLLFQTNKKS